MNYILLSNLMILGMLTYINMSFLEMRFKKSSYNIAIFILFFIILSIINYSGASSLKTISLFLTVFLFSKVMFKNRIKEILFNIFPFFLIFSVSEIFTSSVLSVLISFNELTSPKSFEYLLAICISTIIGFILMTLFIKLRKKVDIFSFPKYSWFVFVLPITTIVFIASIKNYYEAVSNNKSLFVILFGLLVSNFLFIFIFFKVTENIQFKKDIEILKYKDELTNIRYELLDQHYKSNFKFLHDLLNDCRILNEHLNRQEYDKLREKVNVINETAFREFNSIYSNSPILNSIINNYMNNLNENKIQIKTIIEYSNFSFMSLFDQTEFFSLLLDLGIQCCKSVINNEKNIVIKSKEKGNQLIVQLLVSSNCDTSNQISFKFKELLQRYSASYSSKYIKQNEVMSFIIIFKM